MNTNTLYSLDRVRFNLEKQEYIAVSLFGVLDEFGGTVTEYKTDAEIQEHPDYSSTLQELEEGYSAYEYKNNRAAAYPSLADQADMAYWDRQNGTTTLDDAITAVKQKFPK
tara:strand:+ start:372 stop:704 length:333 start_codon:yes stop_codon:yes gene_type:complete